MCDMLKKKKKYILATFENKTQSMKNKLFLIDPRKRKMKNDINLW